jgi:hypothetical protein
MKQQQDSVELGPTWGLRLIESLPMGGYAHDLLTEGELKTIKQNSEKAASAYEIVLANYCLQKIRADASDSEIKRLTTEIATCNLALELQGPSEQGFRDEIERLKTKNSEEAQHVADLAILFECSKLEENRLKAENSDLKIKLEIESVGHLTRVIAKLAIANVDNLSEIRRLKARANRLITDRMFPGKLTDNDLTKEVIE